jgi:hypothetical protein
MDLEARVIFLQERIDKLMKLIYDSTYKFYGLHHKDLHDILIPCFGVYGEGKTYDEALVDVKVKLSEIIARGEPIPDDLSFDEISAMATPYVHHDIIVVDSDQKRRPAAD